MSNRNKPKMLGDRLTLENSLGIFLSENWLTSDILDAEICMDGYPLFRGDGNGRERGGVQRIIMSMM